MFVACLRASIDLGQHGLFLVGETLHQLDEVRDQIGTPLVLIKHLAPSCFRRLLIGRDVVDAAARCCQRCRDERKKRDRATQRQPSRLANALATLRLSVRPVRCRSHASPANPSRASPSVGITILTQVYRSAHRRRLCANGENVEKLLGIPDCLDVNRSRRVRFWNRHVKPIEGTDTEAIEPNQIDKFRRALTPNA